MKSVSKPKPTNPYAVQPIADVAESQRYGRRAPQQTVIATSDTIVSSTLEAQQALFAGREGNSTALRARANSAYGRADRLDRSVISLGAKVNV